MSIALGLRAQTELMRFAVSADLCDLSSISFPAGYSSEGFLIGAQVITGYWKEDLPLWFANVAEQKVESRQPAVFE